MRGKCTNRSADRYSSSLDSNVSRFGCWNLMSSREEELVDEMMRYELEVLGVSEAKMRRNGMKNEDGDATCVYSEVQEGRSKVGVASLLARF